MMKISIKLISAFSRTVLYWIDPGRLVAEQDHENSGHQWSHSKLESKINFKLGSHLAPNENPSAHDFHEHNIVQASYRYITYHSFNWLLRKFQIVKIFFAFN